MPPRSARTTVAATFAATLVGVLVGGALTGCGAIIPTEERLPLTIGTHASLGNDVIAEVYGQYLDNHGYAVSYNPGIGDRENYLMALRTGVVDLVPDFTADLLYELESESLATRLDEVDAALTVALSPLELRVLDPAPAARPDSFVVTRAFADAHGLETITDLAGLAEPVTIAADARWEGRPYGREGLEETYNIVGWTSHPFDSPSDAALAEQLLAGAAQVAVIPVTSPVIKASDLVVLEDHLGLFPAQHLIPVVSADSRSVRLSDLVDTVSAELTTEAMADLLARSARATSTSEYIAEHWLRSRGLID